MNNIDKKFNQVNSIGEFSSKYFTYLIEVLESIDKEEINKLAKLFETAK